MRKVLQVCYCYPPNYSGYGRQLKTLNSGLYGYNDLDIEIITGFKCENENENEIKSLYWFTRDKAINEKVLFYFFCLILPFRFFRDFFACDIVHIIKAGPEAAIATILGKLLGKSVIIKVAQDEVDLDLSTIPFSKSLRLKCILKADKFVAISSKISEDLLRIGVKNKQIAAIPNSVKYMKYNHKKKCNLTQFIFVGSITYRKGVQDLLDALSMLEPKDSKRFRILLVGPNYNELASFDHQIESLKQRGVDLQYLGVRNDVRELINMSDFLILPSYSEGMPNVVLEALISGKPVIVSDISVHAELVTSTNGVLHKLGSPESIIEKITSFDSSIYNSEKISNSALSLYSLESVSNQYHKLYLSL